MVKNKGKFIVEYKPSGIPPSKDVGVEKLMPTFQELADIFRVNIGVDCYYGSSVEIKENFNEPSTINFHIDAFPSKFQPVTTLNVPSIFGLTPSQPLSIEVAAPYKTMPQYLLAKTDLFSPEMSPVGCILGPHIFIFPYILTTAAWSDEDKIKLLRAISYWFLPRIILNILPEHGAIIGRGLNTLRISHRNLYLPHSAAIDQFKKTFRLFVGNMNAGTLENLEVKANEAEKTLEKLSCNYFDLVGKNVTSIARLKMVTAEVAKRDLGKEFESLLIMESIETVRIKDERYLLVKTGPISQIPSPDHEKKTAESYDIGEFIIRIDRTSPNLLLSRAAIRFFQNSYAGPFKHVHINTDSEVCFGTVNQTDNIGLNSIIDNLIADFDIVPLIHLVLTFMKKERNKPTKRTGWDDAVKPQTDYYKNDEEREAEKNRFIQFVGDVTLESSVGYLKRAILELNQKIQSLRAEIILVKQSLRGYLAMLEKLNSFLANVEDINREAACLIEDQSIFGLFISEKELVIHFRCQRIDLLETTYLPEDFILKLSITSSPKLLTLSPKKSLRSIQLIDINEMDTAPINKHDEILICNMQLGRILDILFITKERIKNKEFDPRLQVSTKGR